MIKFIGASMILTACGSMGFIWGRVYEKRPQQLTSLEGALQLLETEIIYGATPLPEAMELVADKCDPEIAGLFRDTALELRKMEGVTAYEAWVRAIEKFSPGTALNNQDLSILKRFGTSLGVSDREDQAKHLQLTKSQLKQAVIQAESASRKNATIYKYLGFLGGLLLILILY